MSTSDRRVLVTGARRGIGKAIADYYTEQGWTVVAPERAELDVGDRTSVHRFFRDFRGPLNAIVNNAGINPISRVEDTSDDDLEATLETNLLGPFRILREGLGALRQSDGPRRVVNVSSIWAGVAKPGRGAYALSKSGLAGLTRTAALEWAGEGILVNSVAPGFTYTELTQNNNTPEALGLIERQIPLGRLAAPAEIASVVYFLGSSMNSYVTGQTLFVDGGFTCQ